MPFVEIGGTPSDEQCAQIGPDQPDGGPVWNQLECRAYIAALRAVYGPEPANTKLRIKSNAHDYGTYREVVCEYKARDPASTAYAWKVEEGLKLWEDAGFWPPVLYDDKGNGLNVIKDPGLWLKANNPHCRNTLET